MSQNLSVANSGDDYTYPYKANQDTVWVEDPANPIVDQTGIIQKGEPIWFQEEPFGSGPAWQIARLASPDQTNPGSSSNTTVCYVQPHHFVAN